MFFVSEEFLRKYEQDKESIGSTLGEVVRYDENLFPEGHEFSKRPVSEGAGPRPVENSQPGSDDR